MTIFKDSHHFSRTLGDVWWQSLRTAIMMTIFKDSHHFSRILGDVWWQSLMTVFNDSAFFERTLRGRFREKQKTTHRLHGGPGDTCDWSIIHLEPQSVSTISLLAHWWFNRDPYNGLLEPPHNWVPSRELTYPTLGIGKSSSKCHVWGIC